MAESCDNDPDWGGCECCGLDGRGMERGHAGPHACICGATWDDYGRPVRFDGTLNGSDLPHGRDNAVTLAIAADAGLR